MKITNVVFMTEKKFYVVCAIMFACGFGAGAIFLAGILHNNSHHEVRDHR